MRLVAVATLPAAVFALALPVHPARACGFKAGGAIGALRYDVVNHTQNPVNIVMYANPKSEAASKTLSPKLEFILTKVGHVVHRVESRKELDEVLKTGSWPCEEHGHHDVQVVIADVKDFDGMQTNGTTVLPIMADVSQYDARLRARFPIVLTPSARPSSNLPEIESAARLVVKRTGPVLLAADTRGKQDERVPTNTLAQRQATDASKVRTPVAAGPDTPEAERGAPISSGPEVKDNTAATPKSEDKREVVSASDSRTVPEPAVEAAPKREPKPEAKTEPKTEPKTVAKKEPKETPKKVEPKVEPKEEPEEKEPPQVARVEPAARAERAERTERTEREARSSETAPKSSAPAREEVYFAVASAKLPDKAMHEIEQHVKWMKSTGGSIIVEGHASSTGPSDINQALSERRAALVKRYFLSRGIPESRIKLEAYGEDRPVHQPGSSPKNRCVVLLHDQQ